MQWIIADQCYMLCVKPFGDHTELASTDVATEIMILDLYVVRKQTVPRPFYSHGLLHFTDSPALAGHVGLAVLQKCFPSNVVL